MRVSPFFFDWTMHLLKNYGGRPTGDGPTRPRDPSLVGFSLSPMRLDEITYPFVRWNVSRVLPADAHLYLHAVPSSWGSVFFADRWVEFLRYYRKRVQLPYYNVTEELLPLGSGPSARQLGDPNLRLPNSRTNVWAGSWKRFLIEYCYGRAMYTMYVRLPERFGLATALQLSGSHVASMKIPSDSDVWEPTPEMLRMNPRVVFPLTDADMYRSLRDRPAAVTWRLPLFNLWCKPDSRRGLALEASRFFVNLSTHGIMRYINLVTSWRGEGNETASALSEEWRRISRQEDGPPPPEGSEEGWEAAEERFLVYQPQFGVSNQQAAFRNAAHWAACLGRTLVVPPVLVPRASDPAVSWRREDLVPYDALFSVAGAPVPYCGGALRTEPLEAFMARGLRPDVIFYAHAPVAGDTLSDAFFDRVLGWEGVPRENIIASGVCDGPVGRRAIQGMFGGSPQPVLALNGAYRCSVADSKEQQAALRLALLRPSPAVESARRAVLGQLATNSSASGDDGRCGDAARLCVQLRLGDFMDVCQMALPWVQRRRELGEMCQPPSDRVRAAVSGWAGGCVLVMTNDEVAAAKLIGEAAAGKKVLMGSMLGGLVPAPVDTNDSASALLHSPAGRSLVALLVEQEVCAWSARAVLNHFSTFGETLEFVRRSNGRPSEWW